MLCLLQADMTTPSSTNNNRKSTHSTSSGSSVKSNGSSGSGSGGGSDHNNDSSGGSKESKVKEGGGSGTETNPTNHAKNSSSNSSKHPNKFEHATGLIVPVDRDVAVAAAVAASAAAMVAAAAVKAEKKEEENEEIHPDDHLSGHLSSSPEDNNRYGRKFQIGVIAFFRLLLSFANTKYIQCTQAWETMITFSIFFPWKHFAKLKEIFSTWNHHRLSTAKIRKFLSCYSESASIFPADVNYVCSSFNLFTTG